MKKLILLIVLITNFCMFNVSYSEAGNTHTGQDAINAGTPTLGQLKYCLDERPGQGFNSLCSLVPGHPSGKDINSGWIDCSGFSKWVYGQLGVNIGDNTGGQQTAIKNAGCKMSTDWKVDRHRINIPTLGWIQLKEKGYIPTKAIVKSGTVSKKAGRY